MIKLIKQGQPPMQDYSAQASVTTGQIIIAAKIATTAPEFGRLEPVLDAALRQARVTETPTTVRTPAGGTPNRDAA